MDTRKTGLKELGLGVIAAVLIIGLSKVLSNTVLAGVDDEVYKLFYSKVAMTVMVLITVIALKKMRIHLFNFKLLFAGILSGLFYLFLIGFRMIRATDITTDTGTRMLLFTISMLLIGYTEEAMFRGLIQNAMHKVFGEESWQAVWGACICTGILFGAAHLTNVFENNIPTSAAIVQAIGNIFVGTYFCAMYYRTGKCLWYVVLFHGLNDFCAFLTTGLLKEGGSVGASITTTAFSFDNMLQVCIGLSLFYLLPALIILRPKKVKPLLGKVVI